MRSKCSFCGAYAAPASSSPLLVRTRTKPALLACPAAWHERCSYGLTEDEMENKPYILLVGVDFSELSDRALREAFAQASQRAHSEVHVLSVLPLSTDDSAYAISVYAAS